MMSMALSYSGQTLLAKLVHIHHQRDQRNHCWQMHCRDSPQRPQQGPILPTYPTAAVLIQVECQNPSHGTLNKMSNTDDIEPLILSCHSINTVLQRFNDKISPHVHQRRQVVGQGSIWGAVRWPFQQARQQVLNSRKATCK